MKVCTDTIEIEDALIQGRTCGGASHTDLSRLQLFSTLAPEILADLACQSRWCCYGPREVVVRPGIDQHDVLLVHSGAVRVEAVEATKELIVRVLRPGQIIDMPSVPQRLADMTVVRAELDGAVIIAVDRAGFERAILSNPCSAHTWVQQLSDWKYALGDLLTDHVFETAGTCFARAVARRAREAPDGVLHYTRAELGAMAGLTASQATTLLHQLRKQGLVDFKDYEPSKVTVPNPELLLDE